MLALRKVESHPRIFQWAPPKRLIQCAWYAWVNTDTIYTCVTKSSSGTNSTLWCQDETRTEASSSKRTTHHCASTGIGKVVAPPSCILPDMSTWDAVCHHTEQQNALMLRANCVLSPHHPDAMEWHLIAAGLRDKHAHVIEGLQTGFKINFPPISTTQTPPNQHSIVEYAAPFLDIIHNEFDKGRYIRPFTQTELKVVIGPFQSSPFLIIPKSMASKYRILQNFSYPLKPTSIFPNPSINSYINSNNYPTTWGTFSLISLLVHHLPPGSELATRDVSEAYCGVPLHSSQ